MLIELIKNQRDKNSGELYATPPNREMLYNPTISLTTTQHFISLHIHTGMFHTWIVFYIEHLTDLISSTIEFLLKKKTAFRKFSKFSVSFQDVTSFGKIFKKLNTNFGKILKKKKIQ